MSGFDRNYQVEQKFKEKAEEFQIPIQLLIAGMNTVDTLSYVRMFEDIPDSHKRHAYRLMLHCVDVLFNNNNDDRVIDEVIRANRKISMIHLYDKTLKEPQRKSLERSAFED